VRAVKQFRQIAKCCASKITEPNLENKYILFSGVCRASAKICNTRTGRVGQVLYSPSLFVKKSSLQKIFGSNPSLKNRRIEFNPLLPYAALRAARQNFYENELSFLVVGFYTNLRTHFSRKGGL